MNLENQDINDYISDHYIDLTDKEMGEVLGLSAKAVKNRRHRLHLMKAGVHHNPDNDMAYDTNQTAIVLEDLSCILEDLGTVEKVHLTKYVTEKKDPTGDITVTENTTTRVVVKPDQIPDWSPVSQAPPVEVHPVDSIPLKRDTKTAIILPDPQIGFRFDPETNTLDPFHDEKAMNVALQIVNLMQPDKIINLGDYLDLPQYSRYAQEPHFAHTTQPAIDRGSSFLAEQRANAPRAEIVVIEGNHDKRMRDYMTRNAMAAFGIKRANCNPEDWPVMSVPFLLRFDELDVEYIEGYPGGEYYINDYLKCIHGNRTGRRGRVAPTIINDERVSTITGHNHHIEIAFKTVHKRSGVHTTFAAIMGCLCRIDGAVPGVHTSLNVSGKPLRNYEDWQQCVGVVYYNDDDPDVHIDPVQINDGRAIFEGREYVANI